MRRGLDPLCRAMHLVYRPMGAHSSVLCSIDPRRPTESISATAPSKTQRKSGHILRPTPPAYLLEISQWVAKSGYCSANKRMVGVKGIVNVATCIATRIASFHTTATRNSLD